MCRDEKELRATGIHYLLSVVSVTVVQDTRITILGFRRVARSKFATGDPQSWSDLWTLLLIWRFLLGACELIYFYVQKSTALIMLKILVATVQNLVARVTSRPDLCTPGVACGWKLCPLLAYLTLVLLTGYKMYPGLVFSSTDLGGIG
jgi:hypothetical protein